MNSHSVLRRIFFSLLLVTVLACASDNDRDTTDGDSSIGQGDVSSVDFGVRTQTDADRNDPDAKVDGQISGDVGIMRDGGISNDASVSMDANHAPDMGAAPSAESLRDVASFQAQAPPSFRALFTTSAGEFTVEARRALAPLGVDRFYNLVRNGYFDGIRFFRVVPNFMVQFGIHGDPSVSAIWRQETILDDPVMQSNLRGFLTYATAGPNTRTTQLFINFSNNGFLDRDGFAAFGEIVDGMEVVDSINAQYGESPNQSLIQQRGNAYLESDFPELDYIIRARLVE